MMDIWYVMGKFNTRQNGFINQPIHIPNPHGEKDCINIKDTQ